MNIVKQIILAIVVGVGTALLFSFFVLPGRQGSVVVYFGHSDGSSQECEKVFPLARKVFGVESKEQFAVKALLSGPTDTEESQGYFSSINRDVSVKSFRIESGVAYVDFDMEMERGMGGSCRVSAIRSQITSTLMQFPGIENVVISVEGRTEDILQP